MRWRRVAWGERLRSTLLDALICAAQRNEHHKLRARFARILSDHDRALAARRKRGESR